MEENHTYFSSIQFFHIEISISQNSTEIEDFLNPSVGIFPSIADWKDSKGADGNAYFPNSSNVLRWFASK
jgi:hypothetical protein